MDEKKLDEICERKYAEVVSASTSPANFERTKEIIEKFCADEKLTHSGVWHRARGIRELRELDPQNERSSISLQWRIRCIATSEAIAEADGSLLDDEQKKILDDFKGISGCEIYTMPNGDFIFLDNPIRHEVVEADNGRMRLHCEDGPAIEFADGSHLYAIDDITVPGWVVTTPAAEITPEQVLAIEDVDVRMIAMRKMGLAKMIAGAREIDRSGDYVLYDFEHVLGTQAQYLYMINPTTGDHHLEGVDNDCITVSDTLRFRAGGRVWNPCKIDNVAREGGDPDQYQQGDVLIARVESVPDTAPILGTESMALLSSANQRRHVASGQTRVEGDESRQYVTASTMWQITHPEHGVIFIPPGQWEVWAVVEVDHITGVLRTVVD